MTIYIFKRHKETGSKTIVQELSNGKDDEARSICLRSTNSEFWFEFTNDIEYAKDKKEVRT